MQQPKKIEAKVEVYQLNHKIIKIKITIDFHLQKYKKKIEK
jgi:hypothetical protein